MRKRYAVRALQQPIPKFFQPRLDAQQTTDCRIIHWDLIGRINSGQADSSDLWDWIETGLTYHRMMQLLGKEGVVFLPEALHAVTNQMAAIEAVIARYQQLGKVEFNAEELAIARSAAQVFDRLLELDKNGSAIRAAQWSNRQMEQLHRGKTSSMNRSH